MSEVLEVTNPPPLGAPVPIIEGEVPALVEVETQLKPEEEKVSLKIAQEIRKADRITTLNKQILKVIKAFSTSRNPLPFTEKDIQAFLRPIFKQQSLEFFNNNIEFDIALMKLKRELPDAPSIVDHKAISSSSGSRLIVGSNFLSSSLPVATVDVMDFYKTEDRLGHGYENMFFEYINLMKTRVIWPEQFLFCMTTGRMAVRSDVDEESPSLQLLLFNPSYFKVSSWLSRDTYKENMITALENHGDKYETFKESLISSMIVAESLGIELRLNGHQMRRIGDRSWFDKRRTLGGTGWLYKLPLYHPMFSINAFIDGGENLPRVRKDRRNCSSLTEFLLENGWLHKHSFTRSIPGYSWELGSSSTGVAKADLLLAETLNRLKEKAKDVEPRPIFLKYSHGPLLIGAWRLGAASAADVLGNTFEVMNRLPEELVPLDIQGQTFLAEALFHRIGQIYPSDPWGKISSLPESSLVKEIEDILKEGQG